MTFRFTDAAAQLALCLHPELKLGELFVDGRLVVERGTIFELLQLILQETQGELGRTAAPAFAQDPHPDAAPQREQREPLQAKRRPPLRSRRAALRPLPRQRPAIFLRLFRPSGCQPRRGAAGQETAYRGQAAGRSGPAASSTSAPAGAASGSISVQVAGLAMCGASPCRRSSSGHRASAPRRPACQERVRFELEDYRDTTGTLRPDRLGRHVRACGRDLLRHLFSACRQLLDG